MSISNRTLWSQDPWGQTGRGLTLLLALALPILNGLDTISLSPGHTLVIPKEPAETLDQLSDEASAAIGRVLPRLCRAVSKATGCADYNILQNNGAPAHQAVFHVHFHIIPRRTGDGVFTEWRSYKYEEGRIEDIAKGIRESLT